MADPNIGDKCISHLKGSPPWMSPDIELISGLGQVDQAQPGQNNTVRLTVHRQANCALPAGATRVRVRLWVGNPSIAMTPNNPASAVSLTTQIVPLAQLPAGGVNAPPVSFNWVPNNTGVQTSGHKCLIVQSWPDPGDGPPDPNAFHVGDDQHHAQRNIAICPCTACEFALGTANLRVERSEAVTLRVVVDPRPPATVLDRLLPTLLSHEVMDQLGGPGLRDELRRRGVLPALPGQGQPAVRRRAVRPTRVLDELAQRGILRLAPNPPGRFALRLPEFPNAKVVDHSNPDAGRFGRLGSPNWQAGLVLAPGQHTPVTFLAELSRSRRGDVHVFYLSQRGRGGQLQGGLTLVGVEL